MNIDKIKKAKTRYIGKEVKYFDVVNSTHKYARQNAEELKNGTIIIAENQTDGIGTNDRKWHTGKENNIAMTIVLKPDLKVKQMENLTTNIARIVEKSILELYNIDLKIKKPNDLLLKDKKICGILTQTNSIGENVNFILISIGFNVNEINFPDEIKEIATSLKNEFNQDFYREDIIIKIIENMEVEELY